MENRLRFVGNVVRKTGDPAFLEIEHEKMERARTLGEQTGLFVVAKVVGFDAPGGVLDIERLAGLKNLEVLLQGEDGRMCDLLGATGRALAAVHAGLRLPADMEKSLPGKWVAGDEARGFLHGDFTLANVCVEETTDRVVIVDWSAAPILGEAVTVGPVYFDVLWFLYYLFQSMPLKMMCFFRGNELARAFVDGYLSADKKGVTVESLGKFRSQMTPYLRNLVLHRLRARPWHKKPLFLGRQLWAYARWRSFTPAAPGG